MAYVRVCGLSELEEDTPKRVELDGTPISLVRTCDEVFAVYDICSHANVSLAEGEVDDCHIECCCTARASTSAPASPTRSPRRAPSPYTP